MPIDLKKEFSQIEALRNNPDRMALEDFTAIAAANPGTWMGEFDDALEDLEPQHLLAMFNIINATDAAIAHHASLEKAVRAFVGAKSNTVEESDALDAMLAALEARTD